MKIKRVLRNVLLGIALSVLALLLLLQIGVTVRYWHYFANSETEFRVPGLWDNFVPQGFEYISESDAYLVSGYMSDGDASRVYLREKDGNVSFATLRNEDLSAYTAHAGGICVNGDYVYLPGDHGVDVFLLQDILSGKAPLQGTIPTGFRVDYCSFYQGYLMVGNFHYAGHYDTPDEHKIQTPAGDGNTSLITVFQADPTSEFGIDPVAVAAFSTTDRVQGMCVTSDGEIVLSTSWSINDSKLLFYKVDTGHSGTVKTLTGNVPVYYLDSHSLTKTVTLPPMAEELVFKDGKVWVMCESACNKYIFGRLIRGGWVYAYGAE